MQLAPIMPREAYDLVDSDYNFCFAEIALYDANYAAYYRNKAKTSTVIMDTMIFERGYPLGVFDWLKAIDIVHPTVTVAMDVLQDASATQEKFAILRQLTKEPLMGVVQGKTELEFLDCFLFFLADCDWIGLPVQVPERRHERFYLLELLSGTKMPCDVNVHLLGAADDLLSNEQRFKDIECLRGVDTTKPIAAALNGFNIYAPNCDSSRPKNYFEISRFECLKVATLMKENVAVLKGALCGQD
jgi:hypothetical protein